MAFKKNKKTEEAVETNNIEINDAVENAEETPQENAEESAEETPIVENAVAEPVVEVNLSAPKDDKKTEVKEKTTRIKMKVDHKCYIGGQWYYLDKGEIYNVPFNVKTILCRAGVLDPL